MQASIDPQAIADAIWHEAREIAHRIVECYANTGEGRTHSEACEDATRNIAGAILKFYRPPV